MRTCKYCVWQPDAFQMAIREQINANLQLISSADRVDDFLEPFLTILSKYPQNLQRCINSNAAVRVMTKLSQMNQLLHGTHRDSAVWRTRLHHRRSRCSARAEPTTSREARALVRPTLIRRSSATKPMLRCFVERTALKIIMSFSRPWYLWAYKHTLSHGCKRGRTFNDRKVC